MTVAECISIPNPPSLPSLEIPMFGMLYKARESLYDLPELSTYIMGMQDNMSLGLAPIRRFMDLMEIIAIFQSCMTAIIDCILPPNPKPIIDCVQDLVLAIGRIAAMFPPFSYIACGMDIANFAIIGVDEIIALFQHLDDKITEARETLAYALELKDIELVQIIDCASGESNALVINSMDFLKMIVPLMVLMAKPFVRLLRLKILEEKVLDEIRDIPKRLEELKEDLTTAEGPPVLTPLMQSILIVRNAGVVMYNTLAPFLGKAADKEPKGMISFHNF